MMASLGSESTADAGDLKQHENPTSIDALDGEKIPASGTKLATNRTHKLPGVPITHGTRASSQIKVWKPGLLY